MFTHILFPTDHSEMARDAFPKAIDLARKYGGKITLLNVHEEFLNEEEREVLRVSADHYKDKMKEKAITSRSKMEELVNSAGAEDICEVVLREGAPKTEILSTAEELGCDTIVMSSNGRSNLKQVLLGSVAEYVVRMAKIPVLVIK